MSKYLTSFTPPPHFPCPNPSLDYTANISNSFYIQRQTQLNVGDAETRDFLFMLAEWYVIFSVFMQINILVYQCTQLSSLEPVFKKKGHEEFNEFLNEKRVEYRVYGRMLLGLSIYEILQSVIQYMFWRGTPYFSIPEPYSLYCRLQPTASTTTTLLSCNATAPQDPKSFLIYRRYNSNCSYQSSDTNCLHVGFLSNPPQLLVGIAVWYLLRFLINTFNLFFCMIMLGRNTKGRKGKAFWSVHLRKALMYTSVIFCVEFLLLLVSNYRLYFRFEGLAVLIVYIIEKVLMFFLLFDKYTVKYWSDNKLKSKYVHIKGIQWREEYGEAMKGAFAVFKGRLAERRKRERVFEEHSVEILAIYQQNFERYAQQDIFQRHFWTYDHKPDKLFQLNWAEYINYQLMVTALGVSGYFLMMIPTAATYGRGQQQTRLFDEGEKLLFSVGFFLAMLEILLLKITKDILLTNVIFRDVATQFDERSKRLRCQYIAEF